MTIVVRRPGPPLGGPVTAITYRAGEQPRTPAGKILPWYLRSRVRGPDRLRVP